MRKALLAVLEITALLLLKERGLLLSVSQTDIIDAVIGIDSLPSTVVRLLGMTINGALQSRLDTEANSQEIHVTMFDVDIYI